MTLCERVPLRRDEEDPILLKALDPILSSPFRIEWLVPLDASDVDDFGRAVAEKAEPILRAARFMASQPLAEPVDMEIRVWVQAAHASACVSITWEPGAQAFGFHLLDESLRERMAVIVFDAISCVGADESLEQERDVVTAAMLALDHQTGNIRIPVLDGPAVDPGIDR